MLVALALAGLPFLRVAPNRLVSGEAVYWVSALHGGWWMLAVPCVTLAVLSFSKARRAGLWLTAFSAASLLVGLAALTAAQASGVAQAGMPLARTSLGSGFWLACVLLGLVMADGFDRLWVVLG